MTLPTYTTPATDQLCKEIAKKSKGVCFLGFSRGKDSLAAWLQLKRYFKEVIPFHCASYPGLKHVKQTLDYYERVMGDPIIRLVGEEVPMSLARMMYQTLDDFEECEALETPDFSKLDIVEELRYTYNLPRAWCAFGINMNDSIDRRIYCQKVGGKNPQNLTFYPTYDWETKELRKAIRESGVKLSGEYKWTSRTLGGVPSATCNKVYMQHYPEDWERIQAIYPLALAKTLREKYLDTAFERRKAMGIVSDESAEDIEMEESAADAMPDVQGYDIEGED